MWFTNIYSNIIVYQKYIGTSIKVGCATRSLYASSGPKAEGVPTNNQRGRGSGPCRIWGGLDKAHHIVPTALLVRVQRLRNDLHKAVKGHKTYSPLDDRWVILTTLKAFEHDLFITLTLRESGVHTLAYSLITKAIGESVSLHCVLYLPTLVV